MTYVLEVWPAESAIGTVEPSSDRLAFIRLEKMTMAQSISNRFVRTASHWGAYWAEVTDGRVVGVKPFERDDHPSPLLQSIPDVVHGENRVDRPYVREGFLKHGKDSDRSGRGVEPFVPVEWETALDLAASEIKRVREEHGNASIYAGSFGWASAGAFHHAQGLVKRFMNGYGGATVYASGYSMGAAGTLLPRILGNTSAVAGPVTTWSSIAENTELIVSFGGLPLKNMQVEAFCAGDHSAEEWLRRISQGNCKFVYVGPIRGTDAADFLKPEWLHPRPASDTAMMLGLAHTLVEEELHDRDFLAAYTVGFERFLSYLMGEVDGTPKTAEWAAEITEIEAETIRALARRMAAARTMITVSWSLQRADHGEQPFWTAITLAAMLGQIGLPGGGFGCYGSVNRLGNHRRAVPSPHMSQGKNPIDSVIPAVCITDMLLNPGKPMEFNGKKFNYPDTRLIYWCGGNPFHHQQNLNRLIEGWRCPETIIVNEIAWTATARHADIVFPATTTLERNDITASNADRYFFAMHKAIEPVGEARNDFDIFADLANRLGFRETFTEGRSEREWLRHLYDMSRQQGARFGAELPDFDVFWESGYVDVPPPETPGILMGDFRADPNSNPLDTPSGKIEIFSETIASFEYDDCPGHPTWIEPGEWLGAKEKVQRFPLHLISNQPTGRLHGQGDNARISQGFKVAGREAIWLNPRDADTRGIAEGDVVRAFNDRGQCLVGAHVTETIMPGVVLIQTGAWYDPVERGKVGSLDRHGNPNVLTLDKGSSRLGQGSSAQTALVEVEKWVEDAPAVSVFAPPLVAAE